MDKATARTRRQFARTVNWDGRSTLKTSAFAVLGTIFLLSVLAHHLLKDQLASGPGAVVFAAILLAAIFTFSAYGLTHHPHTRFGLANGITAARASITSIVAATIFLANDLGKTETAVWLLTALVLSALALDGVDGFIARRLRQASAFGARFDMEIDALLILILSVAGLLLDKAGAWILLIGLMRYAFVAAQYFVPELNRELPPSMRRKLICAVQVSALCIVLVPVITPPLSSIIALAALVLLSYSFLTDVRWLLRR